MKDTCHAPGVAAKVKSLERGRQKASSSRHPGVAVDDSPGVPIVLARVLAEFHTAENQPGNPDMSCWNALSANRGPSFAKPAATHTSV